MKLPEMKWRFARYARLRRKSPGRLRGLQRARIALTRRARWPVESYALIEHARFCCLTQGYAKPPSWAKFLYAFGVQFREFEVLGAAGYLGVPNESRPNYSRESSVDRSEAGIRISGRGRGMGNAAWSHARRAGRARACL